jgi:pimeloyl-ACP methyl ester carboxylesterase
MLNRIEYGAPKGRPLLIAHGLYGSARNWGVISKRMSDTRRVVAVDMRNHGRSPRSPDHNYDAMAGDLAEVIADLGGEADVCGHSMGGKASMVLALRYPEHVARLVVADIAPVPYSHSQLRFAEAMMQVDFSRVERRSDVADQLAALGIDAALQSFFTQSVDIKDRRWLLNLPVLAAEMPMIMGFPDIAAQFDKPTFFLTGANSDYVTSKDRPVIKALFPNARFAKLSGAGHWLHSEKPRAFEASLRAFLGDR